MRRGATILITILLGGAAAAVDANPNDGYIHGTVSARSGATYTGVLRWGTEELFWDDLFNSRKQELPYLELKPEQERERRPWGQRLLGRWFHGDDGREQRALTVRFGDIARIDILGGDDAELTLRNGRTIEVSGGSNDTGATITVYDPSLGTIEMEWNAIERVVFSPAPADAPVPGRRLAATVRTVGRELDGFLQWDSQESIDTDELDGGTRDGKLAIPMGNVVRIERASRHAATVTLRDGRTLELSGTNDVNSDIRGILVEDPRFGRVEVPWDELEAAELRVAQDSGPSFASYRPAGPLIGVVHRRAGAPLRGQLIYDLDESELWEMLDGRAFDLEYTIPFALVRSVSPRGRDAAVVELRSGETLRLEGEQDVTEENDGVAVIASRGAEPVWVPWESIERIELAP